MFSATLDAAVAQLVAEFLPDSRRARGRGHRGVRLRGPPRARDRAGREADRARGAARLRRPLARVRPHPRVRGAARGRAGRGGRQDREPARRPEPGPPHAQPRHGSARARSPRSSRPTSPRGASTSTTSSWSCTPTRPRTTRRTCTAPAAPGRAGAIRHRRDPDHRPAAQAVHRAARARRHRGGRSWCCRPATTRSRRRSAGGDDRPVNLDDAIDWRLARTVCTSCTRRCGSSTELDRGGRAPHLGATAATSCSRASGRPAAAGGRDDFDGLDVPDYDPAWAFEARDRGGAARPPGRADGHGRRRAVRPGRHRPPGRPRHARRVVARLLRRRDLRPRQGRVGRAGTAAPTAAAAT